MILLAADENFDARIVRGLQRRIPGIDIVRIQDTDLASAEDPTVLAWAAEHNRVVLTHDVRTMPGFAYERVRAGKSMPGIVEVDPALPIGQAIEDLFLLVMASQPGEWEGQVIYLPL
ncbi:MAG TPA: DUF5615 family PIN-like protein [Thermoanaerobaculia bacterium]